MNRIIAEIKDSLQRLWERRAHKEQFTSTLMAAVADGRLTPDELESLGRMLREYDLTHDDIRRIRSGAYVRAFQAAADDGRVTESEEAELLRIQEFLGIPDTEIAHTKAQLARLRLVSEIYEGNLPVVAIPGLVLKSPEVAHWRERADLLEERVLGRKYRGASSGMSIRIARGLSYRIGSHGGQIVTERGVVPVSRGELIVTSKKVLFRGSTKNFAVPINRLLDVDIRPYGGIRFTNDQGKSHDVQLYSVRSLDVIGTLLTRLLNPVDT